MPGVVLRRDVLIFRQVRYSRAMFGVDNLYAIIPSKSKYLKIPCKILT